MDIKSVIEKLFQDLLKENNVRNSAPLTENTVLLDTGLDSLSFAVLVARLEEKLGYDPFVLMDDPFYPKTFGEFLGVYEKFKNHSK